MNAPVHLIAGPSEHGVSEYARLLHHHTGGVVLAVDERTRPEDLPPGPVHVTFTDHLFGPDPQSAVSRVLELARGRWLSVSLHDIPQSAEGSERFARRSAAYRRLAAAADLVVANSRHEAAFFATATATSPANLEIIALPLPEAPELAPSPPDPGTVGIIGFLYPGKGHSDITAALSGTGLEVRALGQPSTGHEDLAQQLSAAAERLGVGFSVSGYLENAELWRQMAKVAVPVCAHRHFSASGSLMRWLAAGRRVLVTDGPYPREMAERWPAQIRLVAPTDWRSAILAAVADPAFAEPVPLEDAWSWEDVAGAWQQAWAHHLAPALVDNDHRAIVPGSAAAVSVIIPYYNDAARLQTVLDGLSHQVFDGDIEVIIADDGSTTPPVPVCVHPVRIIAQEDLGFRAAAARNLGASLASHGILAFLDGDTVPDPGYLRAATSWVAGAPRCVVVGRRLHDGVEPEWLRRAWEQSGNLAHSDETSWRFLISAVLTCSKELFNTVGGFDDSMIGYGGEDWELGWRLWQAGAVFLHEPAALARHDEPDWGGRIRDYRIATAEKNAETVALAHRISHPLTRPAGVLFTVSDLAVVLPDDTADAAPGVWDTCIASWLGCGDVQIIRPEGVPELFHADPRVRSTAAGGSGAVAGNRIIVVLRDPIIRPPNWGEVVERVCALGGRAVLGINNREVAEVTSARGRATGSGQQNHLTHPAVRIPIESEVLDSPVRLEARFACWDERQGK